jgi:Tfp pilus assembly protein PilF
MKRLILILLVTLSGCASTPSTPAIAPPELFADQAFAPPSTRIDSSTLFTLSPEMRTYLNSPGFNVLLRTMGKERGLVEALYSKGDLKLEYESTFTRNAAETFRDRVGNCMSLVIMTAAFAKELGLSVRFQSVDMESWSRSSDIYLLSGHVNIMLGTDSPSQLLNSTMEQVLLVDFIPNPKLDLYRMHPLSEDDIVMMFLNNRAAEALVEGHLDDAYWWARAAVSTNPHTAMAFNTLGVIYDRHGDRPMAERVYRAALTREPENLTTLRNLESVLLTQGKTGEAQAITQHLARLEPVPPFHYFNQGVTAYRNGNYVKARDMFQREVRRAPYNDEFHSWLAASYVKLGDLLEAREELALAVDNSTQTETRKRYSAKLSHLRQLGMR